jgi:iron complex transport system substrate-binding protein
MRKVLLIVCLVWSALSLTAQTSPAGGGFSWTVLKTGNQEELRDHLGNTVRLGQNYSRLVVVSPGAVETLFMIGADSLVKAISTSQDGIWPVEKTASLAQVGSPARPSVEAIIAQRPDLIIFSGMNAELAKDLSARGYACLVHRAESIEDIFNATILMGRLTGRAEAAQTLVEVQRAKLATLRGELARQPLNLKGAFIYSTTPIMAFTEKSLPGEMLSVLGVRNIAAGLDVSRPILSPEILLAHNPDFLFGAMSVARPEDLLAADSAILRTRAGRERNITIVPSSLFLRPSPRIVDGILELHALIRGLKS